MKKAFIQRFKPTKEPAIPKLLLKRRIGYDDEDDTEESHIRRHNDDMQVQQD